MTIQVWGAKPSIAVLVFLLFLTNSTYARSPKARDVVVVGTVVAFDQLLPLGNITAAPSLQLVIVRVDRSVHGDTKLKYVRVLHKYYPPDGYVREDLFDGKSKWLFSLAKAEGDDFKSCNMKIEFERSPPEGLQPPQRFVRTPGHEDEAIPREDELPCYLLRPDGVEVHAEAEPEHVPLLGAAQGRYSWEFGGRLQGFTSSEGERIDTLERPFRVRTVRGRIIDFNDNLPIEDILVEIRGPGNSKKIRATRTDKDGRFNIEGVPPGEYMFKATKPTLMSLVGAIVVSRDADPKETISLETHVTGH